MALYEHLLNNCIVASNNTEASCVALEKAFADYMANWSDSALNATLAAMDPLFSDRDLSLKPLCSSTIEDYPKNQIVITQALLYCLEQYGLEDTHAERRRMFFNMYKVRRLAEQKDCCLIRKMNALREGKHEEVEREANLEKCKEYAQSDVLAEKLLTFFYLLKDPKDSDDAMQADLNAMLDEIKRIKALDEKASVAWLSELMLNELQADRWTYLSLVYDRFHENKHTPFTMDSLGEQEKVKLKKIEETYQEMQFLTRMQARGMLLGGFSFGIEVGVLVLEELALNETFNAWQVLVLSAALCLTLGRRLGYFFYGAHLHELQKQNKENYYNAHYGEQTDTSWRPKSTTALVGTAGEGILVLFGLVTSGLFLCDMTTWAAHEQDTYKTSIPGVYFFQKMAKFNGEADWGTGLASVVTAVISIVALFSAWSLARGHYALDGKEMIEFEAQEKKHQQMRCVA